MTGGRIKRLKKYLNSDFLLTYGDGISIVNIDELVKFHKKKKKLVIVTAVRPPARFGTIKITKDKVKYFKEKNISFNFSKNCVVYRFGNGINNFCLLKFINQA